MLCRFVFSFNVVIGSMDTIPLVEAILFDLAGSIEFEGDRGQLAAD